MRDIIIVSSFTVVRSYSETVSEPEERIYRLKIIISKTFIEFKENPLRLKA